MNPRARIPLLLGFMLVVRFLHAQNQIPNQKTTPANQQQTGTIEGHVICEDTRSPARLATVFIIPIPIFDASGKATVPMVKTGDVAKTNLDGNYTLSKVAPGDYFILAELQGYLSPAAQVPWDDLHEPTPDSIKKLAKLLPSVHVEPGKTVRADVVLERGASVSDTVTYEDGAPAIGIDVRIDPAEDVPERERRNILGLSPNWLLRTDDHGRYRINGIT